MFVYQSHIREHLTKLWRESQQRLEGGSRDAEVGGVTFLQEVWAWRDRDFRENLGGSRAFWDVKIAGKDNAQSREDRMGLRSRKSCSRAAGAAECWNVTIKRFFSSRILYLGGEEEPFFFFNQGRILIKSVTKHKINCSKEKLKRVNRIAWARIRGARWVRNFVVSEQKRQEDAASALRLGDQENSSQLKRNHWAQERCRRDNGELSPEWNILITRNMWAANRKSRWKGASGNTI